MKKNYEIGAPGAAFAAPIDRRPKEIQDAKRREIEKSWNELDPEPTPDWTKKDWTKHDYLGRGFKP